MLAVWPIVVITFSFVTGFVGFTAVQKLGSDPVIAFPTERFVLVEDAADALWVSRAETTVGEWLQCVDDNACPDIIVNTAQTDYPVTGVNWHDVSSYLRWYSKTYQTEVRLPTRQEWLSFSADHAPRQKKKLFDDPRMAWAADYDITAVPQSALVEPTGSFGVNSLGLIDIQGNVWEWSDSCQSNSNTVENSLPGCLSGRYAMGSHEAILIDGIRNPGKAGCGAGQPPSNVGFRLVAELRS